MRVAKNWNVIRQTNLASRINFTSMAAVKKVSHATEIYKFHLFFLFWESYYLLFYFRECHVLHYLNGADYFSLVKEFLFKELSFFRTSRI